MKKNTKRGDIEFLWQKLVIESSGKCHRGEVGVGSKNYQLTLLDICNI